MQIQNRKIASLALILGFVFAALTVPSAQTPDQAALAQMLAGQGAAAGAPAAAPTQPVVNSLQVSQGTEKQPAQPTVAAAAVSLPISPIESMFSSQAEAVSGKSQILTQFGYSFFDKPTVPSLASIGDDYILGPGDNLVLYLWGDAVDIKEVSSTYSLTVDRNGAIFFQPAGQISAMGQSLGSLRSVIKANLDRRYKRLEMSLTLASLRQFPVFVSGYVQNPGTVLATGADTLLTVLSRAGGISRTGSLRSVVVTRKVDGKTVTIPVDFYDSLINGTPIDLRVREGDAIYIPAIGPVAAVAGDVKRPGIYELTKDTQLAAVVSLAGGLLPSSRTSTMTRVRFLESGRSIASGDFADPAFASQSAADGDFLFVGSSANLLIGFVQIQGSVKYPGKFEAAGTKSLAAALAKAQLMPETNLFYGRVYRTDTSGRDRSFTFAPQDVLSGADIPLAEFDRVVLYRYDDTTIDAEMNRFPNTIIVSGQVKYPGFYLYKPSMKLSALMAENELTLDASRDYAEIVTRNADGIEEYAAFSPKDVLLGKTDRVLSRLDQVRFLKRADLAGPHDFEKFPEVVQLTGAVARPEVYALQPGMKLSAVLTGDQLLLDTNENYGEIVRLRKDGKNEYLTFRPGEVISGKYDLALGPRDVIRLVKVGYKPAQLDVDRFVDSVVVEGPVEFGGVYAWKAGMKLAELLSLAKPKLETNRVYAEIVRPMAGGKNEYVTFALREVEQGAYDTELKARDRVRLFSTTAVLTVGKAGAQEAGTAGTESAGTAGAPTAGTGVQEGAAATAAAAPGATAQASTSAPASTQGAAAAPATAGTGIETDLGAFLEVVQVSGTIRYQGPYARTPSLKLSSVVTAEQILEETNLDYAELTRLKVDGTLEYHTFSPRAVLEGRYDLALQAKDSLRFVKKASFGGSGERPNLEKFSDVVQLTGQVARPEVYALQPGMKLSAVLTGDQLLLDTNENYAEIIRLRKDGKNEYLTFRPGEVISGKYDLALGSRDVIRLVKIGYAPEKIEWDRYSAAVKVEGPVEFGGMYAWKAGMKLAELLSLAKPKLETNRVYAEVVRPIGGGKNEYVTFALREVEGKEYDLELRARDTVRLYTTMAVSTVAKQGAAEGAEAAQTAAQTAAPTTGTEAEGTAAAALAQAATAPEGAWGRIETDPGLFLEVVQVTGTIRYQGPYARTPGLSLSKVVTKDQILEETNLDYAELTRIGVDGTPEYRTFSPRQVLAGKYDLSLRAKDVIRFIKKTVFGGKGEGADLEKFSEVVQLTGAVARPEVYALREGMKLSEVLTKEQVLLETNLNYGEIVRLRKDGKNEYLTFRPGEVISGKYDLALGPRDVIRLVKVGYKPAQLDVDRFVDSVVVEGPVEFGGMYAWKAGMKLSEVLGLAKPKLETNRVYAEVVRPIGGGKNEYVTFALREVEGKEYDLELRARDTVRLYTTMAVSTVAKQGAAEGAEAAQTAAPATGTEAEDGIETDTGLFLEVVQVTGTIRYQGPYARTPGLSLSKVVTKDQILEETNLDYAELTRIGVDGTPEYRTFSPRQVLAGKYDLSLRAKDVIRFIKKTVFGGKGEGADLEKFSEVVQLTGAVARPEVYSLREGMKLSEVLTKEQVLLETNLNYGEIVRLRKDGKNEYVTFRPGEVISGKYDLALGPRDVIRLVKVGYKPAQLDVDRFVDSVVVEGPVEFGGVYAWKAGMKLAELLSLAKPKLETNRVYAEVVRPIGGGKNEYVTFALREVEGKEYDLELRARDTVRLYTTMAVSTVAKQGAAEGAEAAQTAAQTAAPTAGTAAAPAAGGEAGGQLAGGTAAAAPAQAAPAAAGAGGGIETDTGLFLEVVQVTGTIRYQGPYARTPGLTLSKVVTADQILQDTNLDYAELTRRKADGSWEYQTFSPREVLLGMYDIPMRASDTIRFYITKYLPQQFDFDRFGNAIAIVGAAKYPGLYSISKPQNLSEIINGDMLIATTDIHYAEIERWVVGGRVERLTFSPLAILTGRQDIPIFPKDIIKLVSAGDKGEAHDFSKFPETVLVKGVIRYPGRYAWYEGLKMSDIIGDKDVLIDTELGYAEIQRNFNNTQSILSFSLKDILNRKSDVDLNPRDIVHFYPKYTLLPVTVGGEVLQPKVIPYFANMELSAVLRSVSLSAELASLKAVIRKTDGNSEEVYLEDYLKRQPNRQILLAPGDAITIKALMPDEHLASVIVRGEVKKPQTLEFSDGMRLADALKAAGGYDSGAYPNGLVLIRKTVAEAQQKQIDRLIAQLDAATIAGSALPTSSDTSLNSASAVIANMQIDLAIQKSKLGNLKQLYKEGFGRITLELPRTMEELETSSANILLERDDVIFVPKRPTYVLVSGEVASQNVVLYTEGMTVRKAIAESGWLSQEADLANAYIIRASGKLDSTEGKGFWIFKPNILNFKLNPGDTVFVPMKSAKVSLGWAYLRDSLAVISNILTGALTAKTLLGL